MFNFTNDADNAHFFIQLKGENAGKPLRKQIPNSTGICVNESILLPDYFYYMILNLYNHGKFKQLQRGSAIPFIRQSDITTAVFSFLNERSKS